MRQDGLARSAFEWLKFPAMTWQFATEIWPELWSIPAEISETIAVDARYHEFTRRQDAGVAELQRNDRLTLPTGLSFADISGLSTEMVERLERAMPATLGAASRLPGITPGALAALLGYVRRAA